MYKGTIEYYDEPKDSREYFGQCRWCKSEIYNGEPCFRLGSEYFHEDCMRDNSVEILEDYYGAELMVANSRENLTVW